MGVFSRFRRRKSEASSEEAAAATVVAESAPEGTEPETPEASDTAETTGRPDEAAAAEGVEIPKQQSAEEAADNEAGESARK